jgi:glycosyltransferase involved in cell wall biosynthesis
MNKILFLYPFGGKIVKRSAHVMAQGIIKQLLRFNYQIFVMPRDCEEIEYSKLNGLQIINYPKEYKLMRHLRRILFSEIIPTHFKKIALFLKYLGINAVFERHSLFNSGYYFSKYSNIPYITNDVIVYPDLIFYSNKIQKYQMKILKNRFKNYIFNIEKTVLNHAKSIISHSIAYTNILINEYGIDKRKILQFYAMVDKEIFKQGNREEACKQLELDPTKFNVIYVGSFDRLHTPVLLIPIIQRLSKYNLQFILVGDGPQRKIIMNALDEPNIQSKVVFPGRVNRDKVLKYIQASDLCVESISNERVIKYGADSIKVYEYMSCGKPVIASDLPGQIQELRKKRAGLLINPSDADMFTEAIMRCYNDRELCKAMGDNGRRLVEETWNWDYTGLIINKAIEIAVNAP